jgi:hypothetical protein
MVPVKCGKTLFIFIFGPLLFRIQFPDPPLDLNPVSQQWTTFTLPRTTRSLFEYTQPWGELKEVTGCTLGVPGVSTQFKLLRQWVVLKSGQKHTFIIYGIWFNKAACCMRSNKSQFNVIFMCLCSIIHVHVGVQLKQNLII